MHMADLTKVIVDEFGLPENPKQSAISRNTVLDWMQSDDLEALGALYSFVMKANYASRIQPALALTDYWQFISQYFARCLRENPDGDWVHSRYQAGWDLATWFALLWRDQASSREVLLDIKEWLGNIYRDAEDPIKRCIVDATLEHLFENKEIARFFSDWEKVPGLSTAYSEAREWITKGGSSESK
jgi:hypothetical protein